MKFETFVIAVVYILCMFALISDYKVISNAVGSTATIITIFYLLFNKNKGKNGLLERKTNKYIFLFFAYYIASSLINYNPNKWGVTIMVYIMVFTPYFIYTYLSRTNNTQLTKLLLRVFFVIWTLFLVLCFVTCYETPNLARMMAADRGGFYTIINGGGYCMGYGSAILCPYMFKRLLHGDLKGGRKKFFFLFEIILMIATVLVINSYVTLIALIAGMLIVIINSIAKSSKSKYISFSVAGLLLLVIYYNAAAILGYLVNNTENEFWKHRFEETYDSAIQGDNSAHVDERERVYQISIDGFIKSPLFGNGYKNGNAFEGEGLNGIGNHSTILDSLSQFGLIGALPLLLFLIYPLRRVRLKKENWEYLIPFYLMAYLNPVLKTYHVMVILYMIIPCLELNMSRDVYPLAKKK